MFFPLPVDTVYHLRLVELMMYFRQEKQRIARCDYCWNYFIPKTKAEEFLRRIDTTHELESYDTTKQELLPGESVWQKRVAANLDFDSERQYPSSFMVLNLSKPVDNPQWQYLTAEDLIRKDQEGRQSLREQYGKRPDRPN